MIKSVICPALSAALEKLKSIIFENETKGRNTVIFCEDRLTLAAERTVCAAVDGTFSASVYTFARFLTAECGKREGMLSSQGSAMAIRAIIEKNKDKLKLFGKFSASNAAAAVYDTIALLYSSKISASDVERAAADGLLESKLHDIAVIYSAYNEYLAKHGKTDKNAYLGELPSVIERSEKIIANDVIFLGYQSFTRSALDCVRAAFGSAKNVYGLFVGGAEEIYVNESAAAFESAAKEFGGAIVENAPCGLIAEAEHLRKSLFDAESFYKVQPLRCDNVHVYEAADEEEELEFIAASIKKHVLDNNERYAKISVMLPDVSSAERDLKRVFSQYRIPYYADRRYKLSEHPICSFIINYLNCVVSNCAVKDTDGVIASPLFPAEREDKDVFRNYALRLANFRGGVKRQPDEHILKNMNFDFEAVQRVRKTFLRGLELVLVQGGIGEICEGVRRLLEEFGVRHKLEELKTEYKDSLPAQAELCGRVYEGALAVLKEAEEISSGENIPLIELIKVLKSGFGALEISLIPPKSDAVFVGDLAATANTGSNVVFAARLTDDVPSASDDTSLLTDREIAALEKVNIDISPKIRQVNMRKREFTALNICAFRKQLYLSYPAIKGGEEHGASEIISYVVAACATKTGGALKSLNLKRLERSARALPYFCSEKIPAMKRLFADLGPEALSAVYAVLKDKGYEKEARELVKDETEKSVGDGKELFVMYNSVSPTALETYFSCPYRNFMQQGLKLREREEGAMRPIDTGNFIHTVLQTLAPELNGITSLGEVRARAQNLAANLLQSPEYAALSDSKRGQYVASQLIDEACEVSSGAYEQISNSRFRVENTESKCEIELDGGVKIYGRIDRVDSCDDMVRIIDYKTGTIDAAPTHYYMGLKLQLPLYLVAASRGRRAVAAYYFPASVEFKSKADGVFRLQGFMDGGDDVVTASDVNLKPKTKSEYFDAYLSGKKIDTAMEADVFEDFLAYSSLVARNGANEMLAGNITPSPVADACKYCKMGGSCGYFAASGGAERTHRTVRCADIAALVAKVKGERG